MGIDVHKAISTLLSNLFRLWSVYARRASDSSAYRESDGVLCLVNVHCNGLRLDKINKPVRLVERAISKLCDKRYTLRFERHILQLDNGNDDILHLRERTLVLIAHACARRTAKEI